MRGGLEGWYDEELLGYIPPAYPATIKGRTYRYRTFKKQIKTPGPNSGFLLYLFFFSRFLHKIHKP